MCDIHIDDVDRLFSDKKSFVIKSLIKLLDESEYDYLYKFYNSSESTAIMEIQSELFDLYDGLMLLAHDIALLSKSISVRNSDMSGNVLFQIEFMKDVCDE